MRIINELQVVELRLKYNKSKNNELLLNISFDLLMNSIWFLI